MRTCVGKIVTVLCSCFVFTILNFQQLNAQVQGSETQQIKWLSTSALRSWFSNMGAEIEYGRQDRAIYLIVDQIDGLCWPNEFNTRMKGVKAAKALWIGTTNFADPISIVTYPHKVVCIGKDAVYSGTEIFTDELSLLGKFPHPNVYVDLVSASARDIDDIIDEADPNLVADRVIMNRFHTSIGVSVTRKVLAFSQQYHNNYYIYEYTFKNTGIIDESGQKKLNVPLTGVIFYMQNRLAFPGVSYTGIGLTNAGSWNPTTSSWGRNTIADVIRKDGTNPGEFRANISYWGPMSTTPYGSPAGDIGLPGPSPTNVTELAGYEFAGTVVLHADKAAGDTTDDITQPTTTMYVGADNAVDRNSTSTQYNANLMTQKYTQFMTAGHASATIADQIGKDANGWPTGYGNTFGTDPGGYISTQGYGPYTLNPGDSIRIVVSEAVAGISWDKACEVAVNWFANNTSAFVLPSGYAALKGYSTTTDANEYKNAWVFSGKDSLFQAFRRARANYNSHYYIPQPPPPPENFTVTSGGDRIWLAWSSNAESFPHFNGYRLYRAEGRTDTTFEMIFSCERNDLVNSFVDTTAKRGFNYFYYIQTKDDGSTNDIQPGVPLVSSRYYTMTNLGASLITVYIIYAGDANNDGVVDARDILPIGMYYGLTGTARTGNVLTLAQHWTPERACYADCDGNGIIDSNDVQGIVDNWSTTHTTSVNPKINRIEVCKELIDEIDRQQPLSNGMKQIRNVVVSIMKKESIGVFDYVLDQNWPNPFNPSTTIRFTVPEEIATVKLEIINLLGQHVWSQTLSNVLPGDHEIEWYGKTTTGSMVASGVYFYRLSAGSFTSIKRMLFIK